MPFLPTLALCAFLILLLVSHLQALSYNPQEPHSRSIPIPILFFCLTGYFLALLGLANGTTSLVRYGVLICVLWGAYSLSIILLTSEGIQLPLRFLQPIPFIVLFVFFTGIFLAARKFKTITERNVRQIEDMLSLQKHQALRQPVLVSEDSPPVVPPSPFIQKVNHVIDEQLHNPELDCNAIAARLFMTEKTFSRKLKAQLNKTPGSYLKERRMLKAREYIAENKYHSQKALALAVGFKSPAYFTQQLKLYLADSTSDHSEAPDGLE